MVLSHSVVFLSQLKSFIYEILCLFLKVYEHVYETVDIQGNPEVRAQATAKVNTLVFYMKL